MKSFSSHGFHFCGFELWPCSTVSLLCCWYKLFIFVTSYIFFFYILYCVVLLLNRQTQVVQWQRWACGVQSETFPQWKRCFCFSPFWLCSVLLGAAVKSCESLHQICQIWIVNTAFLQKRQIHKQRAVFTRSFSLDFEGLIHEFKLIQLQEADNLPKTRRQVILERRLLTNVIWW